MVNKIARYMDYLEQVHGLSLSLHGKNRVLPALLGKEGSPLWKYRMHSNPYCFYVKEKGLWRKCRLCQLAVIRRLEGEECFFGTCHAGVSESIHRITHRGEAVGFVSVSGYRSAFSDEENRGFEYLKSKEPDEMMLSTLIFPLVTMLEKYLEENLAMQTEEDLIGSILLELHENHSDVSLSDLAARFHYSPSHISHRFKKKVGVTLKEYCNRLKLQDACGLLLHTDLAVTEISLACGFSNLSYFIQLFRKEKGLTPLQYRNEKRSDSV